MPRVQYYVAASLDGYIAEEDGGLQWLFDAADNPLEGGDAKEVTVRAGEKEFTARVRIDTPKEVEYFKHGGILQYVLRGLVDAQ